MKLLIILLIAYLSGLQSYNINNIRLCNKLTKLYESSFTSNDLLFVDQSSSIQSIKSQILQLGASLDRGQSYNPTSGEYYKDRMILAKNKIESLLNLTSSRPLPKSLSDIEGEWELVFTTVPHGIFRSSPFFLAIQNAYAEENQLDKANLFFKLHELQTCSWGISKVGKVGQTIDSKNNLLISEFDTSLLSLTVFPIIGWGKLFPTFGGTVVTVSKAKFSDEIPGKLELEVEYTTAKQIPGLNGLSESIWGTKVPVGAIWKLLPWNKGRPANCSILIKYSDSDFRVVQDIDGEYFVYTRPIYN